MLVAHGIVNVAVCDVDVAYNRTNLSLQDRRLAALAEKGTNVIIETSQVVHRPVYAPLTEDDMGTAPSVRRDPAKPKK